MNDKSGAAGVVPAEADAAWYALAPAEVAAELRVDPARGLSAAEAQQRLQEYGPNALAAAKQEPVWKQFFKHYADYMQIVLVVAALVSLLIEEYGTAIGLAVLTLFNAWLGYHQEGKAEAAAASLGKMMKAMAKVRRDGVMAEVPAEQIVPGDIVVVDAGDRVPADGRIILAATLQIEEGALTGESVAVEKDTGSISRHDVGLGDRLNMAFMNTNVTRGHGEILVTTTGMGSEVGHIAHMLSGAGGRLDPGRAARRRHHDPVRRLGQHGQEERHHEGPASHRDAGLHVGHQLRQDRHLDPEPDDSAGDRDRAAPLHGER